uniref:Uncharacterized protein n=1 Tax=Schizaphis graminum TaxID=13262 RepID=A0A2S2NTK0_SCHGA
MIWIRKDLYVNAVLSGGTCCTSRQYHHVPCYFRRNAKRNYYFGFIYNKNQDYCPIRVKIFSMDWRIYFGFFAYFPTDVRIMNQVHSSSTESTSKYFYIYFPKKLYFLFNFFLHFWWVANLIGPQ